jgi:hypothetical protein
MQDWVDLYLELSNKLSEQEYIQWVDLWHNQVGYLEDELPFPAPAAFLTFRILNADDVGEKVQKLTLQVDVRYFFETMADSYAGAVNQSSAINFLRGFNSIHALLHGTSGVNYSSMRRVNMNPEETGNTGNLYMQSFVCTVMDYSAQTQYAEGEVSGIVVENGTGPQSEPDSEPLYSIN